MKLKEVIPVGYTAKIEKGVENSFVITNKKRRQKRL